MKHADVILENAVAAAMRVNQKQVGTSVFPFWHLRRHTAIALWAPRPYLSSDDRAILGYHAHPSRAAKKADPNDYLYCGRSA